MPGDGVVLMTIVRPCIVRSEEFIAGNVAATAAGAWPESYAAAVTTSVATRPGA
jgi:hypothetical protein